MQLPQLTSTRFFAAFSIVIFHSAIFGGDVWPFQYPILYKIFRHAYVGVNYFFVLSGFIMGLMYLDEKRQIIVKPRQYWISRFARIYPIYLLAIGLMIAVPMIPPGDGFVYVVNQSVEQGATWAEPIKSLKIILKLFIGYFAYLDWKAVFLNLTLLQAWFYQYATTINPPGWSLSVEVFLYVTFPFAVQIFRYFTIKNIAWVVLFIWLLTITFQYIFVISGNNVVYLIGKWHMSPQHPLNHLSSFLFGLTTAIIFKSSSDEIRKKFSNGLFLMALATILCIIFIPKLQDLLSGGILSPVFAWLIVALSRGKGWFVTILSSPSLVLLGEASYSMYILQMPVYSFVINVLKNTGIPRNDTLWFYVHAVVLTLVSIVCYLKIESPLRRRIRKWAS